MTHNIIKSDITAYQRRNVLAAYHKKIYMYVGQMMWPVHVVCAQDFTNNQNCHSFIFIWISKPNMYSGTLIQRHFLAYM